MGVAYKGPGGCLSSPGKVQVGRSLAPLCQEDLKAMPHEAWESNKTSECSPGVANLYCQEWESREGRVHQGKSQIALGPGRTLKGTKMVAVPRSSEL